MLSLAGALRLPSQPPQRTTRLQLQQQQARGDRGVLLPRRTLLAALPALVALPQHSWAGLFEAGPQDEFRSLVDSLSKVDDLTGQLTSGELKTEEDAIVVLKTATIYFRRAHFPGRSFSEASMSAASPPAKTNFASPKCVLAGAEPLTRRCTCSDGVRPLQQ